jgi:hypothetical protein
MPVLLDDVPQAAPQLWVCAWNVMLVLMPQIMQLFQSRSGSSASSRKAEGVKSGLSGYTRGVMGAAVMCAAAGGIIARAVMCCGVYNDNPLSPAGYWEAGAGVQAGREAEGNPRAGIAPGWVPQEGLTELLPWA